MSELLPCAHCGAQGTALMVLGPTCTKTSPYKDTDRAFPVVKCGGCYAEVWGQNWDDTKKTAIAAWNRRQPISDLTDAQKGAINVAESMIEQPSMVSDLAWSASMRYLLAIIAHMTGKAGT